MAKILVVDDESLVRSLLRMFLAGTVHTVFEAEDGIAALEIHRAAPVHLVIADSAMPRMNGLEMMTVLRRESPDTKIIAMARLDDDEVEAYGVTRTLPKPFTKEEFMEAVVGVLGSRPAPAPVTTPA